MGFSDRHDVRDCECVKYSPYLDAWAIRLDGKNLLCRRCNRYVDPDKWKGGIIHFTNRSRYAKPNECPCCGYKMSKHRIAKKKLVDSIEHQEKFPELHDSRARKKLKKKRMLLDSGLISPTVK
jgi:hypothetical protein